MSMETLQARLCKVATVMDGTIDVGDAATDPLCHLAVMSRSGLNDIARAWVMLLCATVVEGDEDLAECALDRLGALYEEDQAVVAGLAMSSFHRLVDEAEA